MSRLDGLELLVGRVQQVAGALVEGHAGGTDRAVEGDAGDGQRRRGADHRSDVRIGLLAGGDDGADDLHFVHEAFREQRADRPVDQARSQGFLLGRTAFALEEATGDLAGGVGLLLVVHGQREEALARVGGLGADHGHQYADVVIDGHQHCAGCLAGDAARLKGYGRLTELEFLDYRIHGFSFSLLPLGKSVEWRESDPIHSLWIAKSWKPEAGSGGQAPGFQLRASSFWLPARLRLSDADPDGRSGRCNEWCPYPSGNPAACGAG